MFELLRSSTLRHLLARQAPALVISLIVAELFYKFGSFTLECLGFLATWFVLDAVFAHSRPRPLKASRRRSLDYLHGSGPERIRPLPDPHRRVVD